jgi:hypothetical protein
MHGRGQLHLGTVGRRLGGMVCCGSAAGGGYGNWICGGGQLCVCGVAEVALEILCGLDNYDTKHGTMTSLIEKKQNRQMLGYVQ